MSRTEIVNFSERGASQGGELIARDAATREVLRMARSVARTPSTVLLSGESGVGKEVIARAIHAASPRSGAPFIGVNCAAIPPELLESELFGHEAGAFTGAGAQRRGVFERAQAGTLLLDEVSEITLKMQAKLLRVLQERVLVRVGGSAEIRLNVRVIATTNRRLRRSVEEGTFREDLYYRLNVFPLRVPPLRERRRDIEPLALHYLGAFAERFGAEVRGIERRALDVMARYPFHGNVRELVNVCERAIIFASGADVVSREHLLFDEEISLETVSEAEAEERESGAIAFVPGAEPLTDVRRRVILSTLEHFEGNRTRTAESLGISARTVRNKIKDYREAGVAIPDGDAS